MPVGPSWFAAILLVWSHKTSLEIWLSNKVDFQAAIWKLGSSGKAIKAKTVFTSDLHLISGKREQKYNSM